MKTVLCFAMFALVSVKLSLKKKCLKICKMLSLQLMKNWAGMLCGIGFMKPEQTDHFMQGFHRVFSRGVYSRDDAALMLGVARQALWAAARAEENSSRGKGGSNG